MSAMDWLRALLACCHRLHSRNQDEELPQSKLLLVILIEKQKPAVKLLFGMNTHHSYLHFIGQSRSLAGHGSVAQGSFSGIGDSNSLQWMLCTVTISDDFQSPLL